MSEAGEIIGRIKLDGLPQYLADLDTAQARTEAIGAVDPKITVKTEGTAKAVAELEAVKVAEDRVEGSTRKVAAAQKDGARQAADWQSALIGGLVAVSAAAPPVAAAAVGITAALGVMGGAGVLGLAGIVRGMKENNAIGQEYRSTVDSLTTSLHSAEDAGARGLFPGVQKSAALLRQDMPALNSEIGHFAGMLGAMLPTGLDATVTLIERANPLLDAAGGYLGRIVSGIDNWAHGNGYKDFLDYSIRELPEVEKFLGDAGHLVGDFLTAWAPLGSDTLPMLDSLVVGVDDLVKRTGPLVPAAVAFVGAWKLLSPVAGMMSTLVGWTRTLGTEAVVAAGEVDTLAAAETRAAAAGGGVGAAGGKGLLAGAKGLIGAAGVGAGMALGDTFETTDMSKQLLGQAASGKGVQGGSDIASQDAALAKLVGSGNAAKAAAQFALVKQAAAGLHIPISQLNADYPKYTAATTSAGKATGDTVPKTDAATTAYNDLVTAANKAATAQETAGHAAQSLEGTTDAAKDAVSGLSASFKANGTSMSQNTTAGRANREAVLSAVQAIQAHGDAINADGKHALQARISNDTMAESLVAQITKWTGNKKAAEAYVNQLLGIPKNVSTEADLKAAKALAGAEKAKKAAAAYADGDYTAALKADPKNMKSKVAEAQHAADAMASKNYEAFLKANPRNAENNTGEAAKKARSFASGAYTAAIRADATQAISAAARARAALNSVQSRQVYLTVYESVKGQVNAAQVAMNASRYGAHGGTAGSSSFGSVPGLAAGGTGFSGTVRGPGTAASDQAGIYRLANGEEVTSNLWGQADQWRPALKAMNARMSPAAVMQKVAKIAGQQGSQGPTQVINRTIEPHITIQYPATQDPVTAAQEAAQLIQAYSGI